MKGREAIIEARTKGYKPSGMVFVDVGQSVAWQAFLMGENITESFPGRVTMLNDTTPLHPHVCLAPGESARTADWSWCIGLKIEVNGTDPVRVMAAAERIKAAGAARVIATCDDAPWLLMDTDFKEAA